jgi:hypothetical protein
MFFLKPLKVLRHPTPGSALEPDHVHEGGRPGRHGRDFRSLSAGEGPKERVPQGAPSRYASWGACTGWQGQGQGWKGCSRERSNNSSSPRSWKTCCAPDGRCATGAPSPRCHPSVPPASREPPPAHARACTQLSHVRRRYAPICTDAQKHAIVAILKDQSSIQGVRFRIRKLFWADRDFFAGLDDWIFGTFDRWLNVNNLTPKITWDDGLEDTQVTMADLLAPELNFQYEQFADGRSAPLPSKRRLAREASAVAAAAHAHGARGAAPQQSVKVKFTEGAQELDQEWFYETPHAIFSDQRQEERQRPQINRNQDEYNTPFKMWCNVGLPMNFVKRMFATGDPTSNPPIPEGYINQRLTGADYSPQNRKTSVGEGIQFFSYKLAIANNPGVPVRRMWAEKWGPGEKRTQLPPALGRFGMGENRYHRLDGLIGSLHSVSESELDKTDPWRYCNLVPDCHNAHWEEIFVPSWMLGPDETMVPRSDEGPPPHGLPFLSNVPRKPKDLGCELKDTADGECGAICRIEFALKYKRDRDEPQVAAPYEGEWGATTAQCIRLVEPWIGTNRVFGADAHFIGVDSCEGLLLKVPSAARSAVADYRSI